MPRSTPPLPKSGQRSAMFLDFDGTLAELAEHPDLVVVDGRLRPVLQELSRALDGALAIVSGRPIEQLDALLWPLRLPTAGLHGLERRRVNGSVSRADARASGLETVRRRLQRSFGHESNLLLEDKGLSIAVHYRACPQRGDECRSLIERALVGFHNQLELLEGKMILEVKPRGIDKGRAIEAYMAEPPFAGRSPVFAGDDLTDEHGFQVVRRLGGMTIHVGTNTKTHARWQVDSVDALMGWLERSVAAMGAKQTSAHKIQPDG